MKYYEPFGPLFFYCHVRDIVPELTATCKGLRRLAHLCPIIAVLPSGWSSTGAELGHYPFYAFEYKIDWALSISARVCVLSGVGLFQPDKVVILAAVNKSKLVPHMKDACQRAWPSASVCVIHVESASSSKPINFVRMYESLRGLGRVYGIFICVQSIGTQPNVARSLVCTCSYMRWGVAPTTLEVPSRGITTEQSLVDVGVGLVASKHVITTSSWSWEAVRMVVRIGVSFNHTCAFTSNLGTRKLSDAVAGVRGVKLFFGGVRTSASFIGFAPIGAFAGVSNAVSKLFEHFNAHGYSLEYSPNGPFVPQGYANARLQVPNSPSGGVPGSVALTTALFEPIRFGVWKVCEYVATRIPVGDEYANVRRVLSDDHGVAAYVQHLACYVPVLSRLYGGPSLIGTVFGACNLCLGVLGLRGPVHECCGRALLCSFWSTFSDGDLRVRSGSGYAATAGDLQLASCKRGHMTVSRMLALHFEQADCCFDTCRLVGFTSDDCIEIQHRFDMLGASGFALIDAASCDPAGLIWCVREWRAIRVLHCVSSW